MSKQENEGAVEIDEARLEDVSGGPIFMKLDGIDGDVSSAPRPRASGVNVAMGDGSVRFVG